MNNYFNVEKPKKISVFDCKRVPGFSRYGISRNGEVYNYETGGYLRDYLASGYRQIKILNDDNKRVGEGVHRLVVLAWIGPIERGLTVNHKNGFKTDNRLGNLEIITTGESPLRGFRELGSNKNHEMREVIAILRKEGWGVCKIARGLGVSQARVSVLVEGFRECIDTSTAIVGEKCIKGEV